MVLICNVMIGVGHEECVTAWRDCAFESATAGLRSESSRLTRLADGKASLDPLRSVPFSSMGARPQQLRSVRSVQWPTV